MRSDFKAQCLLQTKTSRTEALRPPAARKEFKLTNAQVVFKTVGESAPAQTRREREREIERERERGGRQREERGRERELARENNEALSR